MTLVRRLRSRIRWWMLVIAAKLGWFATKNTSPELPANADPDLPVATMVYGDFGGFDGGG